MSGESGVRGGGAAGPLGSNFLLRKLGGVVLSAATHCDMKRQRYVAIGSRLCRAVAEDAGGRGLHFIESS